VSAGDSFRPLLAAYPARLRRRHGAELIETMLEMAGPEGEPSRADRLHLAVDGLRERFRPPATGRPLATVAAVLALLVGGALGAALGSFAGSFLYPKLPSAVSLAPEIAQPGGTPGYRGSFPTYAMAMDDLAPGVAPRDAVELARQRLNAAGWATTSIVDGDGNVHFRASTDNTELSVYAYTGSYRFIQIAGWPARPAAYLPLTIFGLLLGMVAGWLLATALAHRVAAARRRRLTVSAASTGLVLLLPPAVTFFMSLGYYLFATDPVDGGGLLHTDGGFTFGPTVALIRGLGLSTQVANLPYLELTVFGFALVLVAAIAARPRKAGEATEPVNAQPA
jgi:hypothetical protein